MALKEITLPKNKDERKALKELKTQDVLLNLKKQKYKDRADSLEFEIVDMEQLPTADGVVLFVRAWKNGKQIGFGKDGDVDIERFIVVNPNVYVEDPNGDIIRTTPASNIEGADRVLILRKDPEEAMIRLLEQQMNVKKEILFDSKKIKAGKIGTTTLVAYSEANDVYMGYALGTWTQTYNGTSSGEMSAVGDNLATGQASISTSDKRIQRSWMEFDTSPMGAGATISSAILSTSVYQRSCCGYTAVQLNFTEGTIADMDTASLSNWMDWNNTALSSYQSVDGDTTGNPYRNFTLNATGESIIDPTGMTQICARCQSDITNSSPSYNGNVGWNSSETAYDPYLTIEYTAAGGGGGTSNKASFFGGGI